jgi:uncharacterized protein
MPSTPPSSILRWTDWSGSGLEHAILTNKDEYITARSVVISPADSRFAVSYSLSLDTSWRTLELRVSLVGTDSSLVLKSDAKGKWFDDQGSPRPDLDGAIDVDLSITPLTNTLPIRRLNLAIGESAEIITAYIAFPELTVSPDPQRYTRIGPSKYRYESMDSDFVRDIEFDDNQFVVEYPDLFRRATLAA